MKWSIGLLLAAIVLMGVSFTSSAEAWPRRSPRLCPFQQCFAHCVHHGGGRSVIPAKSCNRICSLRCRT